MEHPVQHIGLRCDMFLDKLECASVPGVLTALLTMPCPWKKHLARYICTQTLIRSVESFFSSLAEYES